MNSIRRTAARAALLALAVLVSAAASRGSVPEPATDRTIRDQVLAVYERDPRLAGAGIEVRVDDGIVELAGTVRTLGLSQEAERLAAGVAGVREIRSGLEIGSAGRSDADIGFAIRNRFERNADIPSTVTVTVHDGVASLGGTVDDPAARLFARDEAANVEGVVGVLDRIDTVGGEDGDTRARVRKRLRPATGALEGIPPTVEAEVVDGTAVLSGRVSRLSQKMAVERAVLGVRGVRNVVNRIEVDPELAP